MKRLRDVENFTSAGDLTIEIREDVKKAREILK